jgi:hypothetical protein
MAVESLNIVKFDIKNDGEDHEKQNNLPLMSVTVSDDKLIELIVKHLPPKRRVLAGNQIRIYFKKIASHPGMRSEYIEKIKQLIVYEKNFNKK